MNTMDDLLALSRFGADTSATVKQMIFRTQFSMTVVAALVPISMAFVFSDPWVAALAPVLGIITFFWMPKRIRNRMLIMMRKQLDESGARHLLGIPRSISIVADGILSDSQAGTSKFPFDALERVVKTRDYAFIILKGGSGYAIPVQGNNEALDAFVSELNGRTARH